MSKTNSGVDVIIHDFKLNPQCEHGPTILFSSKTGKRYFSCSCNRTHDCFYLDYAKFKQEDVNKYSRQISLTVTTSELSYNEVREFPPSQRMFCMTCGYFVKSILKHEAHDVIRGIANDFLKEPSLFLPQLNNDKLNAQYFFDDNTLDFICSILEDLKLFKIICVGAPRLHDYLRTRKPKFKSILLDIDERFKAFNQPSDCIRYNMFNHYFFEGSKDEEKLLKFLKDDDPGKSQTCLFTDPPFAARTELLAYTIRTIASSYRSVNSNHKVLPVMWIFPYFNEHHIQKEMLEMEMLDFQVTYMNHLKYGDNFAGRKAGSPIRIFTNIDPRSIAYPSRFSNYHFCSLCHRFVHATNKHCRTCKTCPSKNGAAYRHCDDCRICVKPNYNHCSTCNRCVQKADHDCAEYQKHQECWFCCHRGHVEKYCKLMKRLRSRKNKACVVCKGRKLHNLKTCPSKRKFLKKLLNKVAKESEFCETISRD